MTDESLAERLADLPSELREAWLAGRSVGEVSALRHDPRFLLRPEELERLRVETPETLDVWSGRAERSALDQALVAAVADAVDALRQIARDDDVTPYVRTLAARALALAERNGGSDGHQHPGS